MKGQKGGKSGAEVREDGAKERVIRGVTKNLEGWSALEIFDYYLVGHDGEYDFAVGTIVGCLA